MYNRRAISTICGDCYVIPAIPRRNPDEAAENPMDPNVNSGNNGHNSQAPEGCTSAEDKPGVPERLPKFLPGSRQISLAALRERIEAEFIAETVSRPDLVSQT